MKLTTIDSISRTFRFLGVTGDGICARMFEAWQRGDKEAARRQLAFVDVIVEPLPTAKERPIARVFEELKHIDRELRGIMSVGIWSPAVVKKLWLAICEQVERDRKNEQMLAALREAGAAAAVSECEGVARTFDEFVSVLRDVRDEGECSPGLWAQIDQLLQKHNGGDK